MSESKKQAILIAILLSTVPTTVVLSRCLIPSEGIHLSIAQSPIDHRELGHTPRTTIWYLPDYPAIESMRESISYTFQRCETEFEGIAGSLHGVLPAREYGMIFVRDTSTMMPALQYFYPGEYLRTPV